YIAPIYGLAFQYQVKYYTQIMEAAGRSVNWQQYQSIIDVGCGTGALCQVLAKQGLTVTGVDAADKMIQISTRNLKGQGVTLLSADALNGLPFADKSFDLAISSYVIHGLPQADRHIFYRELGRVARHKVIFHDYNANRSWLTDAVEWLEGANYFNFIKQAPKEIQNHFPVVRLIPVTDGAIWYVCSP
ncbi:MAG: class I SAM-dependent methyltransferase, partial [Bacteroidales bacterium]|nr:class I SAM-dependent methyltransferase [Bacteroidales bacterium]